VREHYTLERMAARVLQAYQEAVAGRVAEAAMPRATAS
jgi:hypothetical protein